MRRLVIPGLIVAVAVALLALLVYGVSHHSDTSSIDAKVSRGDFPPIPDYTRPMSLLNSSGTTTLAAFRGKVVVLNFYASWCQPCQGEAPLLVREQRMLRRHDATIVGVTYEDSTTDSDAFNRRYGITYPVLRDVSGNLVQSLGVDGAPETFVINRSGHIQALQRYPVTAKWFRDTLMPILEAKT